MGIKIGRHGMSLVEIMVVAAILGFLGLAVSTTFTDIFRMQSRIVGNDEANEFSAAVGRFMFTESTCTPALQNTPFPIGGERNINLPGYVGYGGGTTAAPTTIGAGTTIGHKLRIISIKLVDKKMAPSTMSYEGQQVRRFLGQVVMSTESRVGSRWNANPPRSFEFPVLVDSGNRVLKCMSGASAEDACIAMGSVLDPATGKCTPHYQCYYEGAYTTNECGGTMACTPKPSNNYCAGAHTGDMSGCPLNAPNDNAALAEPDIKCPGGAATTKPTGVHNSTYSVSCGKKCTKDINVVSKYYLCVRCN